MHWKFVRPTPIAERPFLTFLIRSKKDCWSPCYTTLPGWEDDLTGVTRVEDLPDALIAYTKFIEQEMGVPVVLISVGPDREQTLWRA